ncbi:hypothetical protein UY3_03727 [Chelonia mydas]|uniref:Uncharacterized protein n=1 Tax=Chelonia mydas TaxID=8469 RepID=M7C3R6_CHEMY|nr:hypothetical protein UY3_03727 [Chelonia mydas]
MDRSSAGQRRSQKGFHVQTGAYAEGKDSWIGEAIELLLRIREVEEFLDNQVRKTQVPQVQGRMELATKVSESDKVREKAR